MLQTENSQYGGNVDSIVDVIPSPTDTFRSIVDFIRRQYPVLAFALATTVVLGFIYILTTPPSFTGTATLLMDTKKVQLFGQQSIFNDMPIDAGTVESEVEILKSENIALAVIKKLHLADNPDFMNAGGGFFSAILGGITALFSPSTPTSELLVTRQAVAAFEGNLTIRRVGLTYVILISFRSHNADLAAQIANAVADAYIDDQLEAKYDSARRAGTWLQARLKELREQATTAQNAVVAFKNKNNMVDAGGRTINEQQLAELNSQLLVAQSATSEALAKLNRVQSVLTSNDPNATVVATVADSLKNDVITKLRSQYLELSARESDWSARYGAQHLAVVNLRNQMREIQNSIRNELQRIAETYKSDFEISTQHEQSLRKQLSDAVAQSQVTGQAQVSLRELQSNAQTYQALYDNFLQRYMESVQQQSFPSTEARVITAATRPLSKSSPKTLLVMGLSAMVGLAFGFMAAAWRDFADRVFRTVRQVESTLQTDCVALVPLVKSEDPGDMGHRRGVFGQGQDFADMLGRKVRAAASKFGSESAGTRDWVVPEKVTREPTIATKLRPVNAGYQTIVSPSELYSKIIDEPFSAFSESIRSIKVAIDMSPTVTGGRIIGFTSAVPGEGKSTTCAAVARWVATTGAKTLLVDCDLRNPTLSRALAPRTTAGLLQVVNGQSTFEKAVWSDSATGMKFLPAASVSTARLAHSSEILASIHTRKFLDSMRNHYDYVFVDFSPLMPIVDVRASTSLVDSYIFVVSWGNTRIEFVKQALNSAKGVYEHLLGVVLNKVDLGAIDRYDGSGGYYTHESYARYGYSE